MSIADNILFIALPYVAIAIFLVGTIYRYTATGFKFSSLSSQFLEGRNLFWGSVPFHWGILFLFFGHLIAFLFPKSMLILNSHPIRLFIIEISAFMFGISVLVGLINLFTRRMSNDRVRMVTNRMDIAIELLLLLQVITGLWIAYNFRWGSSWFASVLTPYLRSVLMFDPDIAAVAAMPWTVKLHIVGCYIIVLLIPFSRLVHFLVAPIDYFWRPYQQVYWNWHKKKVRDTKTAWSIHRPKNN